MSTSTETSATETTPAPLQGGRLVAAFPVTFTDGTVHEWTVVVELGSASYVRATVDALSDPEWRNGKTWATFNDALVSAVECAGWGRITPMADIGPW